MQTALQRMSYRRNKEVGVITVTVPDLRVQGNGPVSLKEYWRWVFHLVNCSVFGPVQARHSQPAAALIAHRPSLLLVNGLLVGFQHFFKRQFPGFGEVPGLTPLRRDRHSGIAFLSASAGGSGHDCGTSKSILYSLAMFSSSFPSLSLPNGIDVHCRSREFPYSKWKQSLIHRNVS